MLLPGLLLEIEIRALSNIVLFGAVGKGKKSSLDRLGEWCHYEYNVAMCRYKLPLSRNDARECLSWLGAQNFQKVSECFHPIWHRVGDLPDSTVT